MKEFLKLINWKQAIFPIMADLDSINNESDSSKTTSNNWELASDKEKYEKVRSKIDALREEKASSLSHNVIIAE